MNGEAVTAGLTKECGHIMFVLHVEQYQAKYGGQRNNVGVVEMCEKV